MSSRSAVNCKQKKRKILDHQIAETGEIHQNKLCNMQENGQKLNEQIMENLPIERLKPAPTWTYTALDLFGPFKIKDKVKKRTTEKAYGIIFKCLGTRAVYIDISPDYSFEKFLMVLQGFVSMRGNPSKIFSDNGSQLVAASGELKKMVNNLDKKKFTGLWMHRRISMNVLFSRRTLAKRCEALIKLKKRAMMTAISESILTFSELKTVCYEAANVLNERSNFHG